MPQVPKASHLHMYKIELKCAMSVRRFIQKLAPVFLNSTTENHSTYLKRWKRYFVMKKRAVKSGYSTNKQASFFW